ncbi:MAG: hypothetical protein IT474_06680, partial [Arenimonas sp.]|nr:hypothetical protein [Arenimonas sp.]
MLIRRLLGVALFTLLFLSVPYAGAATPPVTSSVFDHSKTGFPLTGAHNNAKCEGCHQRGILKGTPKTCSGCHVSGSGFPEATAASASHIPTTAGCDSCHRTNAWTSAKFDHNTVAGRTCASCHNGRTASGKPADHIATTQTCDSCHRTTIWSSASFNHSEVASGTCSTCHNGSSAAGKNSSHIPTTQSCDACHKTTAWLPATFSHSNVASGTCSTCHNGSSAAGKNS